MKKLLKKGINLLQQLPSFYQKGSVHTKREVLGSIFPEKLAIGEKKCRTTRLNEAVLLITATDKGSSGHKNGQPFKNLELSGVVEARRVKSNLYLRGMRQIEAFVNKIEV